MCAHMGTQVEFRGQLTGSFKHLGLRIELRSDLVVATFTCLSHLAGSLLYIRMEPRIAKNCVI